MSLETKIEQLTAQIEKLITVISTTPIAAPPAQALNVPAPVAPVYAPPIAQATIAPTPAMPALPTFVAPAAPVASAGAPFTDTASLITYVTTTYGQLGLEKGAMIQGVLTQLGAQSLSDIKPDNYGAFYAGVEALR